MPGHIANLAVFFGISSTVQAYTMQCSGGGASLSLLYNPKTSTGFVSLGGKDYPVSVDMNQGVRAATSSKVLLLMAQNPNGSKSGEFLFDGKTYKVLCQ